ncbi:MAG: N-6 DNA methylase [Syntrophaceae bacterium]|nr:MAG: N-6 DNA methylase [Syntrophaceae bacterium]
MARSTVHYSDNATNNILRKLHNKLRPAGTPVQRVEYIIELLLLRIFEAKLKHDAEFEQLRPLFRNENESLLFSSLFAVPNDQILPKLNSDFFPFYARILSEARKVIKGNPSIKVQDQLVLIEEVFSNSNFTNNVTSGNLQEVISLVGELDEERLLKTDLLGDAIESALSETGGTKDIGLFRTPEHIRHFMVALVEPQFSDLILDPACGTAGFLFDAFEYVMEAVNKDSKWPGVKAHPEMAAWFKEYFIKKNIPMPTVELTTDFYRTGVTGIEYLGMIRKMASINFYIRNLNPANIIQGDSLARFKKDFYPESKTAILANPPFGAERDQEAYPDVWSEYPKESETTILFVKLMLETLKTKGRCAVIVSEGFMTWDQNSARALRKSLLEDANLKAIISLPQGLFVSKGGQGPKTSILYFEKGEPTRQVWFYKVINDGYSMGTNRKPIPGCQLTEALDLFHRYLGKGKIPPDTRHSFTIPADWIKALDPRVKERIRTETTADLTFKASEEKSKLMETLTARLQNGKITQSEIDDRLVQNDQIWQGKISNEIARRIERAHLYSFNLPNYRSNLSQSQIDAWTAFAAERETVTDETLDRQYARLQAAKPGKLDRCLSALDPRNALELDIARQFLNDLSPETYTDQPHLQTLSDIITTAAKHPRIKLKDLIEPIYERIKKIDYDGQLPVVEKISFGDGVLHFRESRETGMDLYKAIKGNLITSKINIHQGAIALAPCDLVASTHYQIYEIQALDVHPSFLINMLRSLQFQNLLNEQKNKGIKNEQGADFLSEFEIPLPPLDVQEALVTEIARQQAIITGAAMILANWAIDLENACNYPEVEIGNLIEESLYGTSDKAYYSEDGYKVLRIGNISFCDFDLSDIKRVSLSAKEAEKYRLHENDFLIVRSNGNPALVGKCAVWRGNDDFVYASYLIRFRFKEDQVNPRYVMYYLMSKHGRSLLSPKQGGGTYNISATGFHSVKIALPPIAFQNELVQKLDSDLNTLKTIKKLSKINKNSISSILNQIWES